MHSKRPIRKTHQEYRTHSPRQHVRECKTLLTLCYVSACVCKKNKSMFEKDLQYNSTVYSEVLSRVRERKRQGHKQERQGREIQVNEITAKPAR